MGHRAEEAVAKVWGMHGAEESGFDALQGTLYLTRRAYCALYSWAVGRACATAVGRACAGGPRGGEWRWCALEAVRVNGGRVSAVCTLRLSLWPDLVEARVALGDFGEVAVGRVLEPVLPNGPWGTGCRGRLSQGCKRTRASNSIYRKRV
jgi:hypothetical protein